LRTRQEAIVPDVRRQRVRAACRTGANVALVAGLVAFLWLIVLLVAGGFDTRVFGLRLRSNDPLRPALIAGAVAGGGGGLIGAAFARFLEHRHAHRLQEQLDRGGLVLWVRTLGPEDERRAVEALRANGGDDVHVHDLPKPHYAQDGGVSREMSFMNNLGL
jgi:hypothetical protein